MPELMISPTPAPPQSSSGRADALKQSDAASRCDENAATNREGDKEPPFSAVLKSRMVEQTAGADAGSAASAAEKVAQAATEAATDGVVDLAMLLPLLAATTVSTTSLAPTAIPAGPEAKDSHELLSREFQPVAEQGPPQMIPILAAAVLETGARKPSAEVRDDAPPSASAGARVGVLAQTAGKIEQDAAITAEIGQKGTERNGPDLPVSDFHALIERAAGMAPGATAAANVSVSSPSLRIDTPLGQPQWHEDVGQKLTWMVGNNRQQADLVLTPPQLGRIEVSLTMNGDQASAIFTSPNPIVRDALENSLHRLREVLAEAGVSLGQTQVGSESPNQSARRDGRDSSLNNGARYAMPVSMPGLRAIGEASGGRGMIDIFA